MRGLEFVRTVGVWKFKRNGFGSESGALVPGRTNSSRGLGREDRRKLVRVLQEVLEPKEKD